MDLDLKPSFFDPYGLDNKNDEEEIKEEDEEYRQKLDKIVKIQKKFKKNGEEIFHYFYPAYAKNELCGAFNVLNSVPEKFLEIFAYEIRFSNDFMLYLNPIKDKKLGFLHRNSDLHNLSFKICPEIKNLSEKTVTLVCQRKIFLKEEDYYEFLLAHFFIGLNINNDDVRFYELFTNQKIKNTFVFTAKGTEFSFDFKENRDNYFSIFTFLNSDFSLDYETMRNIKNYVKFMSEYYKAINENMFAKPDKLNIDKNYDFLRLLQENKPINELILQSL